MRRVLALVAMLLLLATTFAVPAQAARSTTSQYAAGRYIVTFDEEPVASYTGTNARPICGWILRPRMNPGETSRPRAVFTEPSSGR